MEKNVKSSGTNNTNEKSFLNGQINWYPGHMTKAKRMMQENIKLIDIVVEILDARTPMSSKNPDIDELAKNKYRLVLLNKTDLADPAVTKKMGRVLQGQRLLCRRDKRQKRCGYEEYR